MFIKTVSTTSGINPIKFDETGGVFYWILNTGLSTIYASTKSAFTAGDDGVVSLGPKESRRLETNNDTIYILGEGQVEIHNQRDGICSFKQAPTSSGSGGGGTIDAYSKTESDAKYAQKTDIPSSLPANGGNADTVGGKSASDFVGALTFDQISNTRTLIPDNVDVVDWLIKNAKIGNLYLVQAGSTGQTNLPPLTGRGWAWFSYDGNRYFCRIMLSEYKTIDYMLDYVNYFGGWKEISTTPIKSTTFSGTTNEYGNVVFTAVGNKIPVFAECSPYCGIPLRFNDNYWIHCIDPITNSNSIAAITAVTGTVYYVEI